MGFCRGVAPPAAAPPILDPPASGHLHAPVEFDPYRVEPRLYRNRTVPYNGSPVLESHSSSTRISLTDNNKEHVHSMTKAPRIGILYGQERSFPETLVAL